MADCTYTVPDLTTSGDTLYGPRMCNQPFIDWAWPAHGFNNDYWQGGWGFDDACNIRKPVSRVLSAMWLINYSARDYENEGWDTDILHWGCRYVRDQFKKYDDLRAQCGTSPIARTSGCQQTRQFNAWKCTAEHNERKRTCRGWHWLFAWICFLWSWIVEKVCDAWGWVSTAFCNLYYGTVGGGENITLFLVYFYPLNAGGNVDVVARAATLIHEARHAGAKPHDAQFPAGSIFGGGNDGADSAWGYEGAWMYEALYLWWYYAAAERSSIALRQSAKQQANAVLMNAFATNPGFVVS